MSKRAYNKLGHQEALLRFEVTMSNFNNTTEEYIPKAITEYNRTLRELKSVTLV